MYDWANSVYNLVITTTFFPAYYAAMTGLEKYPNGIKFLGRTFVNTELKDYVLAFGFLVEKFDLFLEIAFNAGRATNMPARPNSIVPPMAAQGFQPLSAYANNQRANAPLATAAMSATTANEKPRLDEILLHITAKKAKNISVITTCPAGSSEAMLEKTKNE